MFKKTIAGYLLLVFLCVPYPVRADDQSNSAATASHNNYPAAAEVLSLEQSLELGFQNSPQLKNAAQNVTMATEGVRQASGGFLPTLNYTISSTNPPSSGGNSYTGTISANINLYNGGKITTGLKLAQLKLDSALEDQRKAKQKLEYDIKNAFYALWQAQQGQIVAQSSYDNMGRHYQHMLKSNQLGLATKFDVLRAQVQWEGLKPNLIKAELNADLAKINFANLIGLERNRQFKVELDISQIQFLKNGTDTLPTLLEQAYQGRPEMYQADQQVQVADGNIQLARAGYKPTITLSEKYGGGGSELDPGTWDKSWTLTANLTGPIFDGTLPGKISAAKSSLEMAKINQSSLRDKIRIEVESALKNLEKAIEIAHSNQKNIGLSKESLRLTQVRVDAGMATTIDVMDAQLSVDQSLNGYYQGVASYLIALAQLDLALGKDVAEKPSAR